MGIIILKLKSGVEEMVQWIKHSFFCGRTRELGCLELMEMPARYGGHNAFPPLGGAKADYSYASWLPRLPAIGKLQVP